MEKKLENMDAKKPDNTQQVEDSEMKKKCSPEDVAENCSQDAEQTMTRKKFDSAISEAVEDAENRPKNKSNTLANNAGGVDGVASSSKPKEEVNKDAVADGWGKSTEGSTEAGKGEKLKMDFETQDYVELDSALQDLVELDVKKEKKSKSPKCPKGKDERHLWIYNINPATSASKLKSELSKHGKVLTAKIVTDGEKYYGYALMESAKHAKACIDNLNHKNLQSYTIVVTTESPPKKKLENIKSKPTKVEIKFEDKRRDRHRRSRSDARDPLTLKVDSSRHRSKEARDRSRSRSRKIAIDNERVRRQQRESELTFERERRKLEEERRQLQKDRMEFQRLQKMFEEERLREEREKHMYKKREMERQYRSKSPRVHCKPASPARKLHHRRSVTPPGIRPKQFIQYKSPKLDKVRRDDVRLAPPPPPRLTTDDMNREKMDAWKAGAEAKGKLDFYRGKDEYQEHRKSADYREDSYGERKRYRVESYGTYVPYEKHVKTDRDKKRSQEDTMKPISGRSEVFAVLPRNGDSYCTSQEGRRFDNVAYPVQYNRGYAPTNCNQYPNPAISLSSSHWDRSVFPMPIQNKPLIQNHSRYVDYDKRNQYFAPTRKY